MHSRRSDADLLDIALERAVSDILLLVSDVGHAFATVLIDGRSGAGKSSLAARLVRAWPTEPRPTLVALDSLYPGWAGLDAGAEIVRRSILVPRAARRPAAWPRWDWALNRTAESHPVPANAPLIVEGSGVLTPQSVGLADISVWVDAPADERKRRALARDGDGYSPYWEMWAQQENEHIGRDDPARLATLRVELP